MIPSSACGAACGQAGTRVAGLDVGFGGLVTEPGELLLLSFTCKEEIVLKKVLGRRFDLMISEVYSNLPISMIL